jgi:hypothetical protein
LLKARFALGNIYNWEESFKRRHEILQLGSYDLLPGTDVMILKIFSPKNWQKIGVFDSTQSQIM